MHSPLSSLFLRLLLSLCPTKFSSLSAYEENCFLSYFHFNFVHSYINSLSLPPSRHSRTSFLQPPHCFLLLLRLMLLLRLLFLLLLLLLLFFRYNYCC